MKRMRLLAAALFVLGADTTANAQQTATPNSKGEYLARAGDCIACHSVRGGKAFAGGLRMGTPMGAIYSTNITPDPDTGIGNYSLQDFGRAVRSGVAKDGHHLYPAMPYPSYAKISDDDLEALYTFFMKEVPPVKGNAEFQSMNEKMIIHGMMKGNRVPGRKGQARTSALAV
jgi:mono/diheme cytochrome c family protein